ncbi:MAG: energy-coupling factor transporter transmembrane protein EcfT, partial [Desulfovibrionaceae bacterium]|nr:energy-coupling factor transporter transmembrane protein EcfT [Desulfovibrionaceae bacterium]
MKLFSGFHPAVSLLFFSLAIGLALALTHPACLALSFAGALAYAILLLGKKALRLYMLPMLLFAALVNPLFSHAGTTVLAYFPGGNPLTLESILSGLSAAFLLVTVITWFSCFNAVITGDKIVYLFGRVIPALSLVLRMELRFVPRFTAQAKAIANAQKGLGRGITDGTVLMRVKHAVRILSILVTWALENGIDTADSMRSRGYGLPGRSSFALYRLDRRDRYALLFLTLCGAVMITGAALGLLKFPYYPTLGSIKPNDWQAGLYAVYLAMLAFPMITGAKEALQWKRASNA